MPKIVGQRVPTTPSVITHHHVLYATLVDAVGETEVPSCCDVAANKDIGSYRLTNLWCPNQFHGDMTYQVNSIAVLCSFEDVGLYGLVERSLYFTLELNSKYEISSVPVALLMFAPSRLFTNENLTFDQVQRALQQLHQVNIRFPPRSHFRFYFNWYDKVALTAFNQAEGPKVIRLLLTGDLLQDYYG